MRIQLIDDLRGLAMMYVIFIHVLFWLAPFGNSIFPGFLLIEMPLFFMVTGMANYFAHTDDLRRYYISRLQRLLVPYWCYALLASLLSGGLGLYKDKWPAGGDSFADIVLSWLNPFGTWLTTLPYLSWAMWFIPVYLLVMAVIPFLKQSFLAEVWQTRILPALFFPSLVALFQWMGWQEHKLLWETVFYAFWVYAGFFFIRYVHEKSSREKVLPCLGGFIIGIALMIALYCNNLGSLDMQANKFPPNVIFFCYTFGIMSIVVLLMEQIHHGIQCLQKNRIFNWIFSVYRDNCYSVYLYHPFAFLILKGILHLLHAESFLHQHPILLIAICYPFLLVTAAAIARLFSPIEKIKRIKI